MVQVFAARVGWLEALALGDDVFTDRFGIPVVPGWVGFPRPSKPPSTRHAANRKTRGETHLFFDDDGALVGFGGFKGEPRNGGVELGYAVAPARQGRGIATSVVEQLVARARTAGVTVVTAHTLAEENASTTVLGKCGFTRTAQLRESDGDVWRWERTIAACV